MITEMRVAAAEQLLTVVGTSRDPLSVVLDVALDHCQDVHTRLGAAAIALPYLYPRLSATHVSANHTTTRTDGNEDLLRRLDERLARLNAAAPVIEVASE